MMTYTDTRDASVSVDFRTAVLNGMNPTTGGLYIPTAIPQLSSDFLNKASAPTFRDIAFEMAKPFTEGTIPENDLQAIIVDAYPFDVPVKPIDPTTYILELFHGPTCAFKDVGARFMARVMGYFNRDESQPLHILVATSGDTGSAVGSAFHNVPGIDVTILYPTGRISPLQEKQLSTFTGNVRSLAVTGSFDDCQKLVKTAFTDADLRAKLRLSSANSINIARLLPQSFYYMKAALDVRNRMQYLSKIENGSIIVTVPSGNFGNLTSGCIARKMGAPIRGFIAATNANRTVPDWLETGTYTPRASVATLSNAMDVGAPSNFERLSTMYTIDECRALMAGYVLDDSGTMEAIKECSYKTGYTIDPHGAVGWKAWTDVRDGAMQRLINGESSKKGTIGLAVSKPEWASEILNHTCAGIVLETAHPAKFGETVHKAIGQDPIIPERLEKVLSLPDQSSPMDTNYEHFKEWLLNTL